MYVSEDDGIADESTYAEENLVREATRVCNHRKIHADIRNPG